MQTEPFIIDVPPPTISGTLHMGHLMTYVHIDIIARYRSKIMGQQVICPLGFDDNGDNTAALLERECNVNSVLHTSLVIYQYAARYRHFFASLLISFSPDKSYHTSDGYFCAKAANIFPQRGGEVPLNAEAIMRMARAINWHPPKALAALEAYCADTEEMKIGWSTTRLRKWGVPFTPNDAGGGWTERKVWNTWCISALTPAWIQGMTGRWPTLRCHGQDITRTWTFYTLAAHGMAYPDGEPPFRDLMISGNCLTSDGYKMSKSKGNALDPTKLIAEHGPEALRYWAARVPLGEDAKFDLNVVHEGKRLATKIKNAAIFVKKHEMQSFIDIPLETRAQEIFEEYQEDMLVYDYHAALLRAEKFFREEFCGKYIEYVKTCDSLACKERPNSTLNRVFEICMQMLYPFMPLSCKDYLGPSLSTT